MLLFRAKEDFLALIWSFALNEGSVCKIALMIGVIEFFGRTMFLSPRIALIRNLAVALFNGAISLIILLIAPMGLAGVITNTLMITIASFLNASFCDRVVIFLQNPNARNAFFSQTGVDESSLHQNQQSSDIKDNYWEDH